MGKLVRGLVGLCFHTRFPCALTRHYGAHIPHTHHAHAQVRDREEAARISNAYSPEHLIVNVQDAEAWLPLLDNAGSVFMGRCVVGFCLLRLLCTLGCLVCWLVC